MFEDFISSISKARGRYPVANLVGDYLKARKTDKPFVLGHWLQSLDTPTLEDLQTKLDMFMGTEGPDHAGEDLLIAVDLLSSAEHGEPLELSNEDMRRRLATWFEANLYEKLSRLGIATVHTPVSIDPANPAQVSINQQFAAQFVQNSAPTPTLPTTLEQLKS